MAKQKYDGVVEAVRLDAGGQLIMARLYERRGVVTSDHILVKREDLIQRLKAGQVILSGKRVPYLGSSFETGEALSLVTQSGKESIVLGSGQSLQDDFKGLAQF